MSKSSKSSSTALTVPDVDGFALNQQNQLIHPDPNTYQAFGTTDPGNSLGLDTTSGRFAGVSDAGLDNEIALRNNLLRQPSFDATLPGLDGTYVNPLNLGAIDAPQFPGGAETVEGLFQDTSVEGFHEPTFDFDPSPPQALSAPNIFSAPTSGGINSPGFLDSSPAQRDGRFSIPMSGPTSLGSVNLSRPASPASPVVPQLNRLGSLDFSDSAAPQASLSTLDSLDLSEDLSDGYTGLSLYPGAQGGRRRKKRTRKRRKKRTKRRKKRTRRKRMGGGKGTPSTLHKRPNNGPQPPVRINSRSLPRRTGTRPIPRLIPRPRTFAMTNQDGPSATNRIVRNLDDQRGLNRRGSRRPGLGTMIPRGLNVDKPGENKGGRRRRTRKRRTRKRRTRKRRKKGTKRRKKRTKKRNN